MSEETGVHDECGHAIEAHGADGCALCDCAETFGRAVELNSEGEHSTVEAPAAEGGAGPVQ